MSGSTPRSINCRVDVDHKIWLLVQYGANDSRWHSFPSQQALTLFLTKTNLRCPPKCVTEEQCNKLTEEGIKRIVLLEKEVARYKTLLENSQRQLGTASPAAILRTNSLPVNRVTTDTASSMDSGTSSDPNLLETKLGSYSAGLQRKFANKMSDAKRRGSGSSMASDTTNDPTPPTALAQPASLSRSGSSSSFNNTTASVLGKRDSQQSSVQHLKSLLRQKKPNLTSLDPYATDNSEAAEPSARSSQELAVSASSASTSALAAHTPDTITPAGRKGSGSSWASTPTTANSNSTSVGGSRQGATPATPGTQGTACSDDDNNYWTESDGGGDSSVYDRQRDLEGHTSDTDVSVSCRSDHSSAGQAAAGRPRSPVSMQPRKLRRTNSGSERVAGIALKDEASRESSASNTAVHNTAVDSTLHSPRRTLSADSLASLNSNSNHSSQSNQSNHSHHSNSTSNSRSRSAAPAAKRPSASWTPAPAQTPTHASASALELRADEDSYLSMRLSQDDDESRSMLFAQLGDESRLSVSNGAVLQSAPPAPAPSSPVVSIFGTIMKSVKSLFGPTEGWSPSAPVGGSSLGRGSSSSSAYSYTSYGGSGSTYSGAGSAQSRRPTTADFTASAESVLHCYDGSGLAHAAASTTSASITSAATAEEEGKKKDEDEEFEDSRAASPVERGRPTHSVASANSAIHLDTAEPIPEPVLTLDWSKISAAEQEKLLVFTEAVKKAKLPARIEATLLRGVVTKECTPIDCAVQISNILRLMLRAENIPAGSKRQNICTTSSSDVAVAVMGIAGKISKLLAKLYTRNKKIIVAEALIVRTICACCIIQIVVPLQLYSIRHDLYANNEDRLVDLAENIGTAMERLVLMLNSLFLLPADVPWILASSNGKSTEQVAALVANEKYKNVFKMENALSSSPLSQEKTHIEMFVDYLKEHYTASTAVWTAVKDTILRYDYSYQRDLVSPVKVQRSSSSPQLQRRRQSTKDASKDATSAAGAGAAMPLFDILSSQPESGPAMLPPRSGTVSGRRGGASEPAPPASAASSAALVGSAESKPAAGPSLIGELLKQVKMRAKQKSDGKCKDKDNIDRDKDSADDPFASIITSSEAPLTSVAEAITRGAISAASASSSGAAANTLAGGTAAVPVKRKNALLSNKVSLGHRVNMGVKKKVVISAKTIAATSLNSALNAASLSNNARATAAAGPSNARTTGNSNSSIIDRAAEFAKTPSKAISFNQSTPQSSQDPYGYPYTGDGYFTAQRHSSSSGNSSAKRYRDTTVIESTPMEMLQPRRHFSISSGGGGGVASSSGMGMGASAGGISRSLTAPGYLSSPSPDSHSANKRSRLDISGESRGSSSSGGSGGSGGGRHGGRSSSTGVPLNNLLDAAEDEEEPFTPAPSWRLSAAVRTGNNNSSCSGGEADGGSSSFDTFHYLPSSNNAYSPTGSPEASNLRR